MKSPKEKRQTTRVSCLPFVSIVHHFKGGNAWTTADFSADGRYVGVAGYSQGDVPIWDVETGKQVSLIKKGKMAVRFAADGKSVFTESNNKLARFDTLTGEQVEIPRKRVGLIMLYKIFDLLA